MKYFILSALIILAAAIAAFPRKLLTSLIRKFWPFYGTPFSVTGKHMTPDGCPIYIFQWKPGETRSGDRVGEVLAEIGHIPCEQEDMDFLLTQDDLPKTKSISSETIRGSVMTIHVNNRRPHDVEWGTSLPLSSVDTYASIAHCYERDKRKKKRKPLRSAMIPAL